jgi:hypothetical protein
MRRRKMMKKNSIMSMQAWVLVTGLLLLVTVMCGAEAMTQTKAHSLDESGQESINQEIKKLLLVLRNERLREKEPEQLFEAIKRLGELRAVDAIHDLIKLLTFRRTFEWEKDPNHRLIRPATMYNPYPATDALFAIGKPALPALMEAIAAYDSDSLEHQNALHAVDAIFREEPEEGVRYLKNAAVKATSAEGAYRLEQAAEKAARRVERLRGAGQRERQAHDQKVNQLLLTLDDEQIGKTDPKRVIKAIQRLGQMQAVTAIDDLIRLLGFQRTYSEREGDPILSQVRPTSILVRYPATEALAQIGQPALPALVRVIESADRRTMDSENALYTARLILRPWAGRAGEFFRDAAAKAVSVEAAERLWKAAEEADEGDVSLNEIKEQKRLALDGEVSQLLSIVRDYELRKRDPQRVVEAIHQLGRMRAVEAVGDLIRLITLQPTGQQGAEDPILSQLRPTSVFVTYPATQALVGIGEPALAALAQVIESYDSVTVNTQNALATVRAIFGQKPGGVADFLRNAAKSAETLEGVHRLWQAAEKEAQRDQEAKEKR